MRCRITALLCTFFPTIQAQRKVPDKEGALYITTCSVCTRAPVFITRSMSREEDSRCAAANIPMLMEQAETFRGVFDERAQRNYFVFERGNQTSLRGVACLADMFFLACDDDGA